jgi:hypothetical protein
MLNVRCPPSNDAVGRVPSHGDPGPQPSPPQRKASPEDAKLVSRKRTPGARIRRADFPVCRLGGFPAARSFARQRAFGLGRWLVIGNTELSSSEFPKISCRQLRTPGGWRKTGGWKTARTGRLESLSHIISPSGRASRQAGCKASARARAACR